MRSERGCNLLLFAVGPCIPCYDPVPVFLAGEKEKAIVRKEHALLVAWEAW